MFLSVAPGLADALWVAAVTVTERRDLQGSPREVRPCPPRAGALGRSPSGTRTCPFPPAQTACAARTLLAAVGLAQGQRGWGERKGVWSLPCCAFAVSPLPSLGLPFSMHSWRPCRR